MSAVPLPRARQAAPAPIEFTALRETDDLLAVVASRGTAGGDGDDPVARALQALVTEVDARVAALSRTPEAPPAARPLKSRLVTVPLLTGALVVASTGIAAAVVYDVPVTAPIVRPLQHALAGAETGPAADELVAQAEVLLAGPSGGDELDRAEALLKHALHLLAELPEERQIQVVRDLAAAQTLLEARRAELAAAAGDAGQQVAEPTAPAGAEQAEDEPAEVAQPAPQDNAPAPSGPAAGTPDDRDPAAGGSAEDASGPARGDSAARGDAQAPLRERRGDSREARTQYQDEQTFTNRSSDGSPDGVSPDAPRDEATPEQRADDGDSARVRDLMSGADGDVTAPAASIR